MGVKAQILICVGGLAMYRSADRAIFFSVQEGVKEEELSVQLILHHELMQRLIVFRWF